MRSLPLTVALLFIVILVGNTTRVDRFQSYYNKIREQISRRVQFILAFFRIYQTTRAVQAVAAINNTDKQYSRVERTAKTLRSLHHERSTQIPG